MGADGVHLRNLLIIVCLSLPCFGQITDACRADLKHLKLPEKAMIDDELIPLTSTPLRFLFSKDGVDAYSATNFEVMKALRRIGQAMPNAFTVILVYQDESVRRRKIESLRRWPGGSRLENLKFSTWRFEPTPVWVEDVLMRQWLITGMAYFKPVNCEPEESRNAFAAENGFLEASSNFNNYIGGAMPPQPWPVRPAPTTPGSVLAKARDLTREELRKCGFADRFRPSTHF